MKTQSQISCILFALLLPLSACSGDRGTSSSTDKRQSSESIVGKPKMDAPGFGSIETKPSIGKPSEKGSESLAVEHWIPTKLSECMSLGKDFAAKGNHARARELFEAAAKLDRKQPEPMVELARSYIATNEKGLAIKYANKAVKLAPESSQAYNTLGRAELLRFNYDAAEIAFRQATELNAENVWAWNNLGLVYLTRKNYQEAANALAEATSHKGAEGYMWNNLGLVYEQLDQLDDARDAFDNGAKLGSAVAKASRKRLEGVDTIVVKTAKADIKPASKPEQPGRTYEPREEMPQIDPDDDDDHDDDDDREVEATDVEPDSMQLDVKIDEAIVDEPDDSEKVPPTTL